MRKSVSLLFDFLLIALVAAGVIFRFSWTNWSEGADLHPDEYGLTGTISALSLPKSIDEYFNTRLSPISPYQKYDINGNPTQAGPDNRMRWGQWPIILIRSAAELSGNTGYGDLRLMGRTLSALVDLLSILVLFLIGKRLFGYRIGLLAAAFNSLAVMQIQQSHFMTADVFALFFSTLTVYCAVRLLPGQRKSSRSRWFWYALAGLFLGMTITSKVNLAVLAGVIFLAALVDVYQSTDHFKDAWLKPALRAGFYLALAALVTLLTFRLTQPMSFRAERGDTHLLSLHLNSDWVESMKVAQNESNGINAGPPGEQWTNRPILVFPFVNMLLWGMGLTLGLAAWAGFGWAAWRVLKQHPQWVKLALPVAWVGAYFLFMGSRHVMSMRYFIPIYPFLCLLAAWALNELALKREPVRSNRWLPAVLTGVVLAGTFIWAGSFVRGVYAQGNTRVRATRWIFQNIPAPFVLSMDTGGKTINLPIASSDNLLIGAETPYVTSFTPAADAVVTGIKISHLRSQTPELPAGQLMVTISDQPEGGQALANASIAVPVEPPDLRGVPASATFSPAVLKAGQVYYLVVRSDKNTAAIQRTVLANENWDESLPVRMDGYDPFGQFYNGLTMEVRWPDNQDKRQMYLNTLSQVDYLILPSQRSVWSISRLPQSYPMTMEYYRALFDGSLGFELIAQFQAPIHIGPLYISDLAGSVAWGKPPALPLFNNRLTAAEEAFSVYDHAPVWIFKKRADFNLEKVRQLLDGIDLSQGQAP